METFLVYESIERRGCGKKKKKKTSFKWAEPDEEMTTYLFVSYTRGTYAQYLNYTAIYKSAAQQVCIPIELTQDYAYLMTALCQFGISAEFLSFS